MCESSAPSAPSAPTSQTVTQTSIPDYAKPYVETLVGKQQALGDAAYTPFPGGVNAQVAGFSDLQKQSQSGIAGLQMPGQFGQASNATNTAMNNALGMQYNPNSYTADRVTAPSLNQYSMTGAQGLAAQLGNSPQAMAAQLGNSPQAMAAQLGNSPQAMAAQLGNSPQAMAAQLGAAPQTQAAQFQGPGDVGYRDVNALGLRQLSMQAARDVTTGDFTSPGVASQYMNPYLQQSLNPQIAEAQRQGAIQQSQIGAQATQAGAYGGGRQAIQQAEAQRNMGTNIANIVGQGYNTAFNQAQGQFNTQQQQQLTAQQANQAVQQQANLQNLSSGLQTQGLGAQTGLQAQQLNQQAGMQTGQFNAGMEYNTALQNAQIRQQANLANQAMSSQFGLRQGDLNQQTALANQAMSGQFGFRQGDLNQQTALANQAMSSQFGLRQGDLNQQTALANQAMSEQFGLRQGDLNQQTALANQAMSEQFGLRQGDFNQQIGLANLSNSQQAALANQQASLGVQQLGSGQNMQANLANQSANQQAAQLAAQQQQFGANYGMQGIQAGMQGAVNLANIGNQSLGAQQNIFASQGAAGAQQQAQEQARMAQAQRNFDQQINYPQQQLNNMSNILRGVPLEGTGTKSTYQAPPTALNQLAGLGTLGYGVSQIGRAKGGSIKEKKRPAGLMELALSRMG